MSYAANVSNLAWGRLLTFLYFSFLFHKSRDNFVMVKGSHANLVSGHKIIKIKGRMRRAKGLQKLWRRRDGH